MDKDINYEKFTKAQLIRLIKIKEHKIKKLYGYLDIEMDKAVRYFLLGEFVGVIVLSLLFIFIY